ncbi:uncharacterized protein LOC127277154 [Leptopilina boulardi]|uniref:uncharacterized protein LOC127277154 n=1 Tax=Leptopilina boulardi TaxID=63433 RepID=UPI0021F54C2E|nr:uncharacterized protein LOC127277154 [Leptopilina boulardi]
MTRQQRFSGWYYSKSMYGVICTIACLASATRAQLKYNQSRRYSWDNVGNYLTRAGDFSDIDFVNLFQILDLVSNSEEFQPLTISIGTFDTNSYLMGQISKFFERKLITCYQIDLRNNLSSFIIGNFHRTTWIILAENPQVLLNFNSKLLWNSRNKFLILFLQNNNNNKDTIENYEKLFSIHWKNDGISKILIGDAKDHLFYFYRYLPFEINSHGDFGKIQRIFIDKDNIEIFLNHKKNKRLENNKKKNCSLKELNKIFEDFKNLNNYQINVTIFKSQMLNIEKIGNKTNFSGLDINVMFLLKKLLNADFQISVLSPNYKFDPFENGLKRIESNEADLIMTTYFVKTYDNFQFFDFTFSVHIDKVCFFGKAAGKVPKSFMPFLPISLDFWPIFIIYNILISALWIKFKSFSDRIHHKNNQISLIENIYSSLENSKFEKNLQNYPPKIDSRLEYCGEITILTCTHLHGAETTAQRFFLSGTLIFTIIIFGLYESTLLSSMRKPFEYTELNTLNDVLKTNYPILTKYQNLKDSTYGELKNRVVVLENVKTSLRNIVVNNKSTLGIMRLSTADLEDRTKFYDADGEYLLHVIDECPGVYSLSYIVKRYSPYLERIDKLLSHMSEGGLFFKWYNDMHYPIYKEEQQKLASKPLITVLTLEHYSLSFFILFGAFFCCTFVLIAEILYARSARRINVIEKENCELREEN